MNDQSTSQPTMSLIERMPARSAFWLGVLVSTGTIFGIGLVVLAVLMFQGVDMQAVANDNTNSSNTNNATKIIPNAVIAQDSLRNVRGSGDLTIVEYSDTECPFCKRFHTTLKEVVANYDGQVAWAYKQLPITSLHSKAQKEALATECAADQGKFWEYIDLVFETTNSNDSLADDAIYSIADTVGLERSTFDTCISDAAPAERIATDSAEANQLGALGTPYSVLIDANGQVIDVLEGALTYQEVAALLDSHL